MSFLETALRLARFGFYVFPLSPNGKNPVIEAWPLCATRDEEKIRAMWTCPVLGIEQPYNVGICTSRFRTDMRLVALDVDVHDEDGDASVVALELSGCDLPDTYVQRTPSGGTHYVYTTTERLSNSAKQIAPGLDIRAFAGQLVGAGSATDAGLYTCNWTEPAPAPQWLLQKCSQFREKKDNTQAAAPDIDPVIAERRGADYVKSRPGADKGSRGFSAYKIANQLKDFGLLSFSALELMEEHWAPRCNPPMPEPELMVAVENAYRYGRDKIGVASPEADFPPEVSDAPADPVGHPIDELNKEFAFVLAGGGHQILWETTDADGHPAIAHLSEDSFHKYHSSKVMSMGDGKTMPVTQVWMKHHSRRTFKGFCFRPGRETPSGWYNLFRGFSVTPAKSLDEGSDAAKKSLASFIEHTEENVCHGDKALAKWLLGFFAHLFQRPWEKPLCALVFKGEKGVGKSALADRVGYLVGNHYLSTADRRYLIGNFNSHLEKLLLFTLEEAFWSGDKQADGVLKNLITGAKHAIEYKGKEQYSVENCTRVIIIGNEDWLVPASHDERRYAVFNVGVLRKKDNAFFEAMRKGMEHGGYELLLRYLLDFDLTSIDVNVAPDTEGLLEQKLKSLDPFYQWWVDCLDGQELIGSAFGGGWVEEVSKDAFREAFRRYLKERNIRSRVPEDRAIGHMLKKCLPSVDPTAKVREGEESKNAYKLPPIEKARKQWEAFIGHEVTWT